MSKVSIITTLYNYKQYLPELIKSVADQTYDHWEWIIVDDASTDDPDSILDCLELHSKVKVIHLKENKGYSVAKNIGIKASTGQFITMIDADDVLTPNSLEDRHRELVATPDKLWLHADALNYDHDGNLCRTYIKWNEQYRKKMKRCGMNFEKEYHHRLIHAQTVMVRREFHEKLGLYDEILRFSSDNEMWRRAIRFGHIPMYYPSPVAIYRAHDARMSRSDYKRKNVKKAKKYIEAVVERRFDEGITSLNTELL